MAPTLPDGFRLIAFESVGSTNDEAKRFAGAGAADGLVVTAAEQRAGRGRLGRSWASPPGNLYASFVARPKVPLRRAPECGFVAAIAVHEAIGGFAGGVDLRCKWPNDVLAEGRKVAGILAEATALPSGDTDYVVVGCGINLAHFPPDSRWPASSLAALGIALSPEDALAALAAAFAHWRQVWEREGFEPVRAAWTARSFPFGKEIRLNLGQSEISGGFAGLGPDGALLLDVPNGRRETISYGEMTAAGV